MICFRSRLTIKGKNYRLIFFVLHFLFNKGFTILLLEMLQMKIKRVNKQILQILRLGNCKKLLSDFIKINYNII